MDHHEPLQLERFLPYRLSILSNTVSHAIAREYQQRFALSVTEWRVMAILARFPDSSAREVTEHGALDKVAVSRAVARLVASGRVSRATHDGDRRRSVLNLTPAGWEIHDVVAPLARQHERDVIDKLSADELKTLVALLDKLSPV
ncbi:MAG TPA: MarR family winged helix-turn-helix transcriptional regulator [Rhodanobacteraceae bacterium]